MIHQKLPNISQVEVNVNATVCYKSLLTTDLQKEFLVKRI